MEKGAALASMGGANRTQTMQNTPVIPGQPPTPATPAVRPTPTRPAKPAQALVVEGWLSVEVKDVPTTAQQIRDHVGQAGGRITNDQISGGARSVSGHLKIKLPPERVDDFLAWLDKRGTINNKRIQGTDVSRTLFDQAIALENLQLTLDRMRKLLDKQGLAMNDILAIEREMTRLRGEIERIKGEKRFLEYRVAMATLDVNLTRQQGVVLGRAEAKFYPGARLSTLILIDPEGRERTRFGGGAVIHTLPRLTLELDVFGRVGDESRAVVATFGGAAYSDFLGRGKNRFLNPYLGARLGYGYLEGSAFVLAAGGGIELFKHEYALLDASVNFVGFIGDEFDAAITGSLSAVIAF